MPKGGIRPICSISNCGDPHSAKGFCGKHYKRFLMHGDPFAVMAPVKTICATEGCASVAVCRGHCRKHHRSRVLKGQTQVKKKSGNSSKCLVNGCVRPVLCKNLCPLHYDRVSSTGSTDKSPTSLDFIKDTALSHEGDACLKWPFSIGEGGYGRVAYNKKTEMAHRVVCLLAHGPNPCANKKHVAHSCNNRWCVSPHHLRWATVSENMLDKRLHGTHSRGGRSYISKLTAEDVVKIRSMLGSTSQREIGRLFGVTRSTVNSIKRGSAWDWLDG